MAQGPGKYDDLTTYVREKSGAEAVVVIVLGGKKGHGFSVQACGQGAAAEIHATLSARLRAIADEIDKDGATA